MSSFLSVKAAPAWLAGSPYGNFLSSTPTSLAQEAGLDWARTGRAHPVRVASYSIRLATVFPSSIVLVAAAHSLDTLFFTASTHIIKMGCWDSGGEGVPFST